MITVLCVQSGEAPVSSATPLPLVTSVELSTVFKHKEQLRNWLDLTISDFYSLKLIKASQLFFFNV